MGLNGFTEWLFSALLSWMQIIYNWFWSMLASGGQNEFMPWFSDNWIKVVLILLAAGLIIDYTIYLMRWQPYHIWLNTLRRARGYVARPFVKETPKRRYAGYRRVLEDVDGVQADMRAPDSARAPERPAQAKVRVYEAEPAAHTPARDDTAFMRPAVRPPVSDAHIEPPREYEPERAWPERESGFAPVAADNARDEYARPDSSTSDYARDEYEPLPENALDAEGYIPEHVITPDESEPMFSAPPTFARSEREGAPLYGRVYQTPGQPILPLGMDGDERRPQVELPDMAAELEHEHVAAPVQPVQPMQPVQPKPAVQQVQPAQPKSAVQPMQPAQPKPAVQQVQPVQRPVEQRPERRPAPEGYTSRRSRAASAAQQRPVSQSASVQPVQQAQPVPRTTAPIPQAQPVPRTTAPIPQAQPAPRTTAPVRSISVHETGATRDMDFDDEM